MIECKECLFLPLCLNDTPSVRIKEEYIAYPISYPKRMFECCSSDPISMIQSRNFLIGLKRMNE